MKRNFFVIAAVVFLTVWTFGDPLVLRYDRYYDYKEVYEAINNLKHHYPDFVKIEVIGKSYQGRDIWAVTLNNPKTGKDTDKPAMYADGNIHGNEIQGTEVTLYMMDYLLSNYGRNKNITELLDRVAFYIVPIVNPDGRASFMASPNSPDSSRENKMAFDDDRDGKFDEDDDDDLDGDGNIVEMRKKVPLGTGDYKLDPTDPRLLVRVKDGEKGDYVLLGMEGIDNDGDGKINEDPVGGIDLNRDYGFNWMPRFRQYGAGLSPFSTPEINAVKNFLLSHKNIGATENFHNSGGMILRGPGAKNMGNYPLSDVKVYNYIGKEGEKMLPGYRYMVCAYDLYTVYGGFNDWSFLALGIISFTNELYFEQQDFNKDGRVDPQERMKWNDEIMHGEEFVEWHPYDHPTYGKIEIGGWKKLSTRIPPGFQLEELCHRNSAFVLFNARHLPMVKIEDVNVENIKADIYRVTVLVMNDRMIPTRTQQAVTNNIGNPDYISVSGNGVEVISGGIENSHFRKTFIPQKHHPEKIMINCLQGMESKYIQWIVKGNEGIVITYESEKGGKIIKEIKSSK